MTPAQRTLRARIGAYALHARYDSKQTTSKARASFLAKFELEVDPDGVLTPEERSRRADAARRCHFARMALKSSQCRRRKSAA